MNKSKYNDNDFILVTKKKTCDKSKGVIPAKKGIAFLKSSPIILKKSEPIPEVTDKSSSTILNKSDTANVESKILEEVCKEYNIPYNISNNIIQCDDWFALMETDDRIKGIDNSIDIKNNILDPIILYKKIAFIYSYIENDNKKESIICNVKSIMEFASAYNTLIKIFSNDFMLKAFKDKTDVSKNIFKNLMETNGTPLYNLQQIKNKINEFNHMHPSWSFIKNSNQEDVKIPFKKINDLVVNEINLNIKETNNLKNNNLIFTDANYRGFVDQILIDFVIGNFPNAVVGLIFQKTISMHESKKTNFFRYYYHGFRIRILINPDYSKDELLMAFETVKNYIKSRYVKFNEMIVSLASPRK